MSHIKRIQNVVLGILTLLLAAVMLLAPKESLPLIAAILSLSLFAYGFKTMWFYFRMARHMVGSKKILYRAIITLDLSLFLLSMVRADSFIIMVYLLFVFVFKGFVDVLRAFEAKKNGSRQWRPKLIAGIIIVLFAIAMLVVGIILGKTEILVYGYCVSLVNSAVIRIISAFKRTAVVYVA